MSSNSKNSKINLLNIYLTLNLSYKNHLEIKYLKNIQKIFFNINNFEIEIEFTGQEKLNLEQAIHIIKMIQGTIHIDEILQIELQNNKNYKFPIVGDYTLKNN